MNLSERVDRLEQKVRDQNDVIETVVTYAIGILEENDQLWKYIMRRRIEGIEFPFHELDRNKQKFRSKTPPPLQEPKVTPKEQTHCYRGISHYSKRDLERILKRFRGWIDRDEVCGFLNERRKF